jgi:hypothetical protein
MRGNGGRVTGLWARWRSADPLPAALVVTALVVWGARGLQTPLTRDPALYLYAGQQVAAGEPPYVGVLNRSGPFSHLLPGLGVELGRLSGVGDVMGAKLLYLALAVSAPALVYLLARTVYGSRLAGLTAAGALISVQVLAVSATGGPEAKLPMMVVLLLTLLLLVRRHWLWAGVATAVATLTWQPVLFSLAPAAVFLAMAGPDTLRARAIAASRYIGGGVSTLGLTLAGFWLAGALDAFVEGYWTVNASYTQQSGAFGRPDRVLDALYEGLGWTTVPVLVGCVLSLGLGISAFWFRRTAPRRATDTAALAVATAGTVTWCGIAFNQAPDGLSLYPLAALGLGGAVGALAHVVRRAGSPLPRQLLVVAVAGWVAICAVLTFDHTASRRSDELVDQRALAEGVMRHLPEDATVFSFEATQPLVLTRSTSISRFVLFDHGMSDYVATLRPGGLNGYVAWLLRERPDVVFMSTRNPRAFVDPLLESYVKVSGAARLGGHQEWRTYVRDDLGTATITAIRQDVWAARRARAAKDEAASP